MDSWPKRVVLLWGFVASGALLNSSDGPHNDCHDGSTVNIVRGSSSSSLFSCWLYVAWNRPFARPQCLSMSQVIDHTQRLGCAEAGGYATLKAHTFFAGTDWGTLHLQNAPELHPFLPANSEDSENLWSQYKVMFWPFVIVFRYVSEVCGIVSQNAGFHWNLSV